MVYSLRNNLIKYIYLIVIIFFAHNLFAQDKYYLVHNANGAPLMNSSGINAIQIGLLPHGTRVSIITLDSVAINQNEWIKVQCTPSIYKLSKREDQFRPIEGYVQKSCLDTINLAKVHLEKISKQKYWTLRGDIEVKQDSIRQITDLEQIKEVLGNQVEWIDLGYAISIKSLLTDHGVYLEFTHSNGEMELISYFPDERILYFFIGHSLDLGISLVTGAGYRTIGIPIWTKSSENNTFRLAGLHNGQECVDYFIEKNINREWVYYCDLPRCNNDDDLCQMGDVYWISDNEFICTESYLGTGYFYGIIEESL